jgi:hypothetical protein
MPFVRVVKTNLIKQLLILTPLSLSGIFLATQLFTSVSSSSRNQNAPEVASSPVTSSAPAAGRRSAPAPSARTGTPLSGTDPGDPFGGGNPGGNSPAGAVPVDGGLSLLLAAGLGFGVKKANDYRKSRKFES